MKLRFLFSAAVVLPLSACFATPHFSDNKMPLEPRSHELVSEPAPVADRVEIKQINTASCEPVKNTARKPRPLTAKKKVTC